MSSEEVFLMIRIELFVNMGYNYYKGVDNMNKEKIVDLLASLCLLTGSVINIIKALVDVHIVISIIATVLIFVSIFLWFVVLKRIKSKK